MIPFLFALTFPFLLILVIAIAGLFLLYRWVSIVTGAEDSNNTLVGDMKVHTFYSTLASEDINEASRTFVVVVVGVVFGGIHCVGWFFSFPSSDEAILWRVCSANLTGIAFLLPVFFYIFVVLLSLPDGLIGPGVITAVLAFIVYVVSRLVLLVEAFVSLRHLTPGMLAIVKWTSFIPHI